MYKFVHSLHWAGFIATCFMLVLAVLDQSKDEVLIHVIASLIPNTVAWVIASSLSEKRHYFPFYY